MANEDGASSNYPQHMGVLVLPSLPSRFPWGRFLKKITNSSWSWLTIPSNWGMWGPSMTGLWLKGGILLKKSLNWGRQWRNNVRRISAWKRRMIFCCSAFQWRGGTCFRGSRGVGADFFLFCFCNGPQSPITCNEFLINEVYFYSSLYVIY